MSYSSRMGARRIGGLHICPECGSKLVQPTCWEQTRDQAHWRIWRRCPECGWRCDSVHDEHEIDAYDQELDRGTEALAEFLNGLERESMQDAITAFQAALEADLITAEDFR